MTTTRRQFLAVSACTGLYALTCDGSRPTRGKIPYIHVTDCFRPHRDPDDHWDLATVFALAHTGIIDLRGIVLDAPWKWKAPNTPDVMAVAQMNHLTGLSVPVVMGTPKPLRSRTDSQSDVPETDLSAVHMLCEILQNSPEPVAINVTGSATDVAVAMLREPELFRQKCAGVYLNAGVGAREESEKGVSHNIAYDPAAYAAMFDLPCPLYWAPCFGGLEEGKIPLENDYPEFWRKARDANVRPVREYGSFWRFRQDAILPHLSPRVQNFFAYMFERLPGPDWLQYLKGPAQQTVIEQFGGQFRNMWSTAAILHAADQVVTRDSKMTTVDAAGDNALFSFDAIQATCDDRGVTTWAPGGDGMQNILHIIDTNQYTDAMIQAVKTLLIALK